jgi:hypothetical protein
MARPKKKTTVFLTYKCPLCGQKSKIDVSPDADELVAPEMCDLCKAAPPVKPPQNSPSVSVSAIGSQGKQPGCQWCRAPLASRDELKLQECQRCSRRILDCVVCGEGRHPGEEVCPKCIQSGIRVCDNCLRPAPKNSSMCQKCDADFKGMNAANFKPNEVAPNHLADQQTWGTYLPDQASAARVGI